MAKQDDWARITLRLPKALHGRLLAAAAASSLNAEIVTRLEASFAGPFSDERAGELLGAIRDVVMAQRLTDLISDEIAESVGGYMIQSGAESWTEAVENLLVEALIKEGHWPKEAEESEEERVALTLAALAPHQRPTTPAAPNAAETWDFLRPFIIAREPAVMSALENADLDGAFAAAREIAASKKAG